MVTCLCCFLIKSGIEIGLNVGTCSPVFLVILPFSDGTSGPYMSRARLASSAVTGQLIMTLFASMCSKCFCDGRPSLASRSRALSAPSISRLLKSFFKSETVCTKQ